VGVKGRLAERCGIAAGTTGRHKGKERWVRGRSWAELQKGRSRKFKGMRIAGNRLPITGSDAKGGRG